MILDLDIDSDIDDVDIDGPAGSPRGQFSTPGTAPTAFSGWLQLAQAIETTLDAARRARPTSRTSRPSTDTDQHGWGPKSNPPDTGSA
jgi:hypothetical protein